MAHPIVIYKEENSMKIMLVCYGGLSTSILVNNMKKAIDASEKFRDKGIVIEAWGKDEYVNQLEGTDCILLGPQVSMIQDDVKRVVAEKNFKIPVEVINKEDYGMMAAVPILLEAFKFIKANRQAS